MLHDYLKPNEVIEIFDRGLVYDPDTARLLTKE